MKSTVSVSELCLDLTFLDTSLFTVPYDLPSVPKPPSLLVTHSSPPALLPEASFLFVGTCKLSRRDSFRQARTS